jgi:branched-chain amino acid transport system permease protein
VAAVFKRETTLLAVLAPCALIVLICGFGLISDNYWKYVWSVTITSILMGLGLTVLVGFARCISLCSGAMIALGAYGSTRIFATGTPYLVALLGAVTLGAIGGLILGLPSVRFRSHNLAMVTLVFQAVVILILREWKSLTGGAEGLHVPAPVIFGVAIDSDLAFLLFITAATLVVLPLICIVLLGAFGKNLRAIASNEVGARAYGISIESHLVVAFVLSSAVLAFAGALNAPRQRIIDPDSYGILLSIFTLAGPIIGGVGSLWGGIVGGALMRLLPEFLRPVADYTELLLAGLVVAIVIFMPSGIVGLLKRLFVRNVRKSVGRSVQSVRPVSSLERLTQSGTALRIAGVSVNYDGLKAVDDVSLEIPQGTIFGLMGPNGAGKTTLFNVISGFVLPSSGSVALFDTRLVGTPVHRRIGLGMARTFQQVAIFPTLTCRDNVIAGLGRNKIQHVFARSFASLFSTESNREEISAAEEALEAVGLRGFGDIPAGSLSLGDQRRLEIARAIVSRPKMILLDEPVSGVADAEIERISELLKRINKSMGVTMLIVEHNIGFLASLSDNLAAMVQGRILAVGTPDSVVGSDEVRQAYFGEARSA